MVPGADPQGAEAVQGLAPAATPTMRAWILATLAGWLLGIPSVALFALIGEAIGLAGKQVMIGAGMGVSLGLLQARVIRRLIGHGRVWILSCAGGLAAALGVGDLAEAMGWASPYRLHLAVITGGALAGIWQTRILRSHATDAWMWIPANVLGWSAAAAAVAMADGLFQARVLGGAAGALVYLGLVVSGGVLLGVVTGVSLRKLFADPNF